MTTESSQIGAPHQPDTVPQRGMRWSIKSTFATYVESMSDGEIIVMDGAERLPDGSFFFPLEREELSDSNRILSFRGAVQFTGHRGMLAVSIGGVLIEESGDAARLSIADSLMPDGRLTMVELPERQADGETIRFPEPRLTEDGADLFFENYPVGTAFDPLWLLSLTG